MRVRDAHRTHVHQEKQFSSSLHPRKKSLTLVSCCLSPLHEYNPSVDPLTLSNSACDLLFVSSPPPHPIEHHPLASVTRCHRVGVGRAFLMQRKSCVDSSTFLVRIYNTFSCFYCFFVYVRIVGMFCVCDWAGSLHRDELFRFCALHY